MNKPLNQMTNEELRAEEHRVYDLFCEARSDRGGSSGEQYYERLQEIVAEFDYRRNNKNRSRVYDQFRCDGCEQELQPKPGMFASRADALARSLLYFLASLSAIGVLTIIGYGAWVAATNLMLALSASP